MHCCRRPPEIVRIGSRSKSKRLEQYNLKEMAWRARSLSFSPAEARRFGALHSELESVTAQVKHLADKLAHVGMMSVAATAASAASSAGSSSAGPGGLRGQTAAGSSGALAAAAMKAQAANTAWQQRSRQLSQEEEDKARQRRLNAASNRKGSQNTDGDDDGNSGRYVFDEWADGMRQWLCDELPNVLQQLLVPIAMNRVPEDYLWNLWLKGAFHKGSVDRFLADIAAAAAEKASGGDGGWKSATSHRSKRAKWNPADATRIPSAEVKAAAQALAAASSPAAAAAAAAASLHTRSHSSCTVDGIEQGLVINTLGLRAK